MSAKQSSESESSVMNGLGRQLVTGVMMALVGALLTFLLQSGRTSANAENSDKRLDKLDDRIGKIETTLANGGPQPLAQRVQSLEDRVLRMENQVNAIYAVVVLKAPASSVAPAANRK